MEQQIAKRAKEYARGLYPDMRDWEKTAYSDCRRDYAHGARDQHKIDIEKACELTTDIVEDLMARYCETWSEENKKKTLENIRKAMEQ